MEKESFVANFNLLFPDAVCELNYKTPYQLLVAVILSAQCTDKRVNIVTNDLFTNFDTPEKMLTLSQQELEKKIHSCGFFRNKAKSILSASEDILNKFGGEVPYNFDDLLSLRGVGRKTANVVISEAFKGDAFAVDTHVLRVSNRLGLTSQTNPDKAEIDLKNFFDKKDWSRLHYQMVLFGRYKCKAIKPDCLGCPFYSVCKINKK